MLATSGQQVLHQRRISGIHCTQAMKYTGKGIHPGFETQGRCHQKSKTGLSVAPHKGLIFSEKIIKKKKKEKGYFSTFNWLNEKWSHDLYH